MTEYIYINEVGPRDGLQNQKTILDIESRTELIKQLIEAGMPGIEVGSFVSPKAVPAMAGTGEIVKSLENINNCDLSVLIPNMKGYELARDAGAKIMTVVPSATETMNQKNINMSLDETVTNSCSILQAAKSDNFSTRAYVSVAWECPYEGIVNPNQVLEIAEKLISSGADEIILADTIGAANPASVSKLVKQCVDEFGANQLSAHFHDTRAMALSNVCAALNEGIRKFDACIAGLGGCPFAPGAAGNLATEDLCNMLEQMGYQTNIDLNKLNSIVDFCAEKLDAQVGGRMTPWLRKTN
jgi:hydroxymethylglutaryl-CoA lyase